MVAGIDLPKFKAMLKPTASSAYSRMAIWRT